MDLQGAEMSSTVGIGRISMGDAFRKTFNDLQDRRRRQRIEDEDRAWKQEDREALRQERAEKAQLKRDLSDAAAPRTTMAGTVTQSDAGQVFSATPENARLMQETLAAEAELRDGPAPTQQAGYAITGPMSKGHQIAKGVAPEGAADSEDSQNKRTFDAYRRNGLPDKAMQMEESIIGLKAKRLGLQTDEYNHLNARLNSEMDAAINGDGSSVWFENAKRRVNESFKDVKLDFKLSADGKTVELFAVKPDGTKQSTGVYPSDASGGVQYVNQYARLPVETKAKFDSDRRKQEQDRADKAAKLLMEEAESKSKINVQEAQATYYKAAANAKDSGVTESSGVNMDTIDKTLGSLFKTKDDNGVEAFDTNGMLFVRELALLTPEAASGDSTGAALKAHSAYAAALKKAGGNHDVAVSTIKAALPSKASPTASAGQPTRAATPGATRVSPQEQAARDSDAPAILQSELVKAQQRLAAGDVRAQGDIESLQRELRALGVPVAGTAMRQAAAPAATTAAQTVQPAQPVVKMAAQLRADPLAGKSQQQIREIKDDLQKERKRWAGNPNADRRIAEIDQLLDRIDKGRY